MTPGSIVAAAAFLLSTGIAQGAEIRLFASGQSKRPISNCSRTSRKRAAIA
jgi:hypothetical protein